MGKGLKRLTAGAAALVLAVTLAACGGKPADTSSGASGNTAGSESSKPSTKKQTLVIYAMDDQNFFSDKSKMDKVFGDFQKKNNVDLQFVTTKSADQIQKITVAANSNAQIDLMFLNGQYARTLYTRGLLAELDSVLKNKDALFNKSALDTFTFGGKLYAYPYGEAMTSALFYNKDLFQKNNLTPPVTYADLVNVTKAFNKQNIQGIAFGGASKFMWPMWYFETFYQTSGNKGYERTEAALTGQAKFTDPDYVEAMEALAKFGKDGIFQQGVNGADSDAGKALFVSGKAAMFYGGTWEVSGFSKSLGDKLGISFFPVIKDGAKVQMTGAGGSALAMYSKIAPEHKDLAAKFMEYYYSDPVQKIDKELSGGAIPATKNAPAPTDPLTKELTDKFMPETSTFLDWYWPQEIVQEFQFQIQAVIGGAIAPKDAMAKIQDVFDKLKEKGYDFNSNK